MADGFDIDNPDLPDGIDEAAFTSGGYPHDKKMKRKAYEKDLRALQIELLKMQYDMRETGKRVAIVFEGRDAAGKGGTISRVRQHLNPRHAHVVALSKPTETERGQWYFQRYVDHMPTAGDLVMFDRSWYNRAGVEPVMGFCTPEQNAFFLQEAPKVEKIFVDDGIKLIKLWLNVGREMQLKRFHARRHDVLNRWKLSGIDIKGIGLWDEYTAARNAMFEATDSAHAPWTVIRSNDKMRARLNAIRTVLNACDYEGKDESAIGDIDPGIALPAREFLSHGLG